MSDLTFTGCFSPFLVYLLIILFYIYRETHFRLGTVSCVMQISFGKSFSRVISFPIIGYTFLTLSVMNAIWFFALTIVSRFYPGYLQNPRVELPTKLKTETGHLKSYHSVTILKSKIIINLNNRVLKNI